MNILLICETVNHGVGEHVKDVIEGLLDRGHSVTLVWSGKRTGKSYAAWIGKLQDPLFTSFKISMNRSPALSDIRAIMEIRRIIKINGPYDVIHGMSSKGGALARILGLIASTKSFYSPHAYILFNPSLSRAAYWFYFLIERILSYRSGVVCSSIYEVELTKNIGIQKYRYIPNGISVQEESLSPRLDSQLVDISFVGRLDHQKNPLRFIDFAVRLSHLPVRFNIFGDGELRDAVVARIPQSIYDRVKFWGYVAPEVIWGNTDVIVCTSHYEGFPYVFIQAMANGVPLVSTDVGGARDIIVADEIGALIDDDCNNACEFVSRFVNDISYRQYCRLSCFSNAKRFSKDRMIEDLIDFYRS